MIDAKSLLDQFLGSGSPRPGSSGQDTAWRGSGQGREEGEASSRSHGLADAARQALRGAGGLGGFAGGAATGGLLGMLLGGGKRRSGMLSHGGAAVLGALAHRAWQNWQSGQAPATAPPATSPSATGKDAAEPDPRFLPSAAPAAGGEPFELALIRAMIAAAGADGHIDAQERAHIFEQVDKAGLDAEAKAFVFETLDARPGITEVAQAAQTPEQASELYLASRLAIDPNHPAERAYLQALAHRLKLPPDLAAHLDRQAEIALPG